jgi:uncharacterized protein YecA (UPF0149 family)
MGEWVSEKKWKTVTDRDKQDWKTKKWELMLKRGFNGAEEDWNIELPAQVLAPQRIHLSFLKRKKTKRREIRNNELQLQRFADTPSG